MLFLLLAVVAFLWFVWPIRASLFPTIFIVKQQEEDQSPSSSDVAEIDGGVWQQLSILEHVELGLKKRPDGPAVTCLFRPRPDLEELVAVTGCSRDQETQTNGYFGHQQHVENGEDLSKLSNGNGTRQHSPGSSPRKMPSSPSSLWNHQATSNGVNGTHERKKGINGINGTHDRNGINGINGTHETNGINGVKQRQTDKMPTGLWAKAGHGTDGLAISPPDLASAGQFFELTYRQLHASALGLAGGLLRNGARPETTMLMLIPNGAEYAILLWTCILLRITYVSVDPSSLDISGFTALKHTVQSLKPQIVVAPDSLSGRAVDVAMAELGLPQPIRLCLSRPSSPSAWKSLATVARDARDVTLADDTALVLAARQDRTSRVHCIFFTSGTSGVPKGCPLTVAGMSHDLHSQAWLLDSDTGTARFALQQAHNSRAICPLQMLQTWRAGGSVLLTERGLRVDDVAEAVCGSHPYRATFIVLSPPMVHELAAELAGWRAAGMEPDVSSLKRIQLGGDVVTKDILAKCAMLFPQAQVCINHGMSEGPGMFSWPFFDVHISQVPFFGEICPVGVAAPGSLVRVWDAAARRTVNRGQLGELHVSRGSVIRSYWAGRSSESFRHDEKGCRWFNTGDVGMVNQDGLIFILGRKKDMIKRAGVGIMPAAIESSIEAFTGAQTIVVPVAHHVLGAEPFAVLSSYNGKTDEEIKEHVRASLGKEYALGGLASLKHLGLVEFPINATHKIMKSEIQTVVENYLKKKAK